MSQPLFDTPILVTIAFIYKNVIHLKICVSGLIMELTVCNLSMSVTCSYKCFCNRSNMNTLYVIEIYSIISFQMQGKVSS